jgi:hypothetical protein
MVQSGSIPDTARHNNKKESVTMQDNYKTIATKLANLESFWGNSMSAQFVKHWGSSSYSVYSYGTLIAEKTWDNSEGKWRTRLNETKYSVTTSKHQNLIKRAWGIK